MLVYTRDVPRDDFDAQSAEVGHIVAHLSAVASADDDPETSADDVVIRVANHPDNPDLVRIVGTLNAEADAPYLKDDYEPLRGVDPALVEEVIGRG